MAGGPDYLKGPMSGTSGKGKPVTGKTGYVPPKKTGGKVKKVLPKAQKAGEVNKFKPSTLEKGLYKAQNFTGSMMSPSERTGDINRTMDSLNVQDKAYRRYTPPKEQYKKAEKIVYPSRKTGGVAKPKAAYGKTVKPSMMKKGGAAKKKK